VLSIENEIRFIVGEGQWPLGQSTQC
jgi:hypothetical protein